MNLHDIGHQDGVDLLVMELGRGEPLGTSPGKGTFAIGSSPSVRCAIADARPRRTKWGSLSRDLKPANIMWTQFFRRQADGLWWQNSGTAATAHALTEMDDGAIETQRCKERCRHIPVHGSGAMEGKEAAARTIFLLWVK